VKIKGLLVLNGADFLNDLEAYGIEIGGPRMMQSVGASKASFKNVILRSATIAGRVNMVGASFDGKLDAQGLRVGDSLLMSSGAGNRATFHDLSLIDGQVASNVEMIGASVAGTLNAGSLKVGGSLLLGSGEGNEATYESVILMGTKVTRNLEMTGARVDGRLDAESIQIGGNLSMRSDHPYTAKFKRVDLAYSTVKGEVQMDQSTFDDEVFLTRINVGDDVSLREITAESKLIISSAQIGGNLDFSGAKLARVDLGGASIAGEMRLGDESAKVTWVAPDGEIDLRNAHVGSLSDNQDSWPKRLSLNGFSFGHFGGYDEDSGTKMIERGADWWDENFVRLDTERGPLPYEQLAAVFSAAGDHEAADKIHYDERVWAGEKVSGLAFIWSQFLRWGAGYGIGTYMFRALWWALGLSFLGAVFLRLWANKGVLERKHNFIWCCGASINRLLPVLSLKKEFVDFFDDPKLNQFTPCQDFIFVAFGVLGWVIGAVVIAAFATITHAA
jgi:hypothetical protein